MNVDLKIISNEICNKMNSYIIFFVNIFFLFFYLRLNWFMRTRRSFFIQILLLICRHLTLIALTQIFDFDYKHLFFIIRHEIRDYKKIKSLFIINATKHSFFKIMFFIYVLTWFSTSNDKFSFWNICCFSCFFSLLIWNSIKSFQILFVVFELLDQNCR